MVENVIDLVTLAGKAKAKAFLAEQLRYTPMPATVITALRRGRTALGIKPFKSGNAWFWETPAGR